MFYINISIRNKIIYAVVFRVMSVIITAIRLFKWLSSILIIVFMYSVCNAEKRDIMKADNKTECKFTNKLIDENSPYLLSHAHNPVNWYPWGEEALEKARTEDKPIFLSIGYSACHWCHVMERESFENEQVADVLNKYFISIKVDREQRPDLDQIYMSFTTALTGGGGWPMSVFLTPDLKPFFAGTYFPPEDRYGRPGFMRIIEEIGKAYIEEKETIISSSEDIFSKVTERVLSTAPKTILNRDMIKKSASALISNYDEVYGGFGQAPKFPHAMELSFFMKYYKDSGELSYLNAVEKSLQAMSQGGIYDHLAGGFARYSTDRKWLIPHFEKMLYDNALLVTTYIEAYQLTKKNAYLKVARETLDFILDEMTDKTGGFYSAIDADSEGEEGKFYVWSKKDIDSILGDKSETFCEYYNITDGGNFEGENILNVNNASARVKDKSTLESFDDFLYECRQQLLKVREQRQRPLTDDKILTSWNGLALSALSRGYQVTGETKYLQAARKNALFIKNNLYKDGKLTHAYRKDQYLDGLFLEDYSYFIRGLLDLYETDIYNDNKVWLDFAIELTKNTLNLFIDNDGHFFLRPDDQKDLIIRPKDETDSSIPAPGSIMIYNLIKLNRLTDDQKYLTVAESALKAISGQIERYPGGMTSAVMSLDYYLNDKIEIVIVGSGESRDNMLKEIYRKYLPNRVIAVSETGNESMTLFKGRNEINNGIAIYICRNSECKLPVSNIDDLKKQLHEI